MTVVGKDELGFVALNPAQLIERSPYLRCLLNCANRDPIAAPQCIYLVLTCCTSISRTLRLELKEIEALERWLSAL